MSAGNHLSPRQFNSHATDNDDSRIMKNDLKGGETEGLHRELFEGKV
jgi:hypothetical protein